MPAGRMVQWVEELAHRPDDLSSASESHKVAGENQLLRVVS